MAGKSVSSINVLVGTSASAYVRGLDTAISATKTKGAQWGRVMKQVSMGVGAALLGVAAASVRMSNEFEQSLTKMRTLVGLSAEDVEKFKGRILDLSRETGRSAVELAEGLYFITSSGLEGAEAFEALEASAKAAAIGMGETEQIADALTSVLNAYGHSAYTANEATNILLKTVKLGKAEADQLAASIGQVIPNAAQLGVNFEELGSAIAAITLTGKNASEAVTGVNSILLSTIKASSQGSKRLAEVGLSYASLRNELKTGGLSGLLALLKENFEGNVEAITDILGRKEAITTFFALTGKSSENYAKVLEDMKDATDELGNSMDIYSDTKGAKWKRMTQDLGSAMVKLGDAIGFVYLMFTTPTPGDTYIGKLAKEDAKRAAEALKEVRKEAKKTWEALSENPNKQPTGMALLGYGQTGFDLEEDEDPAPEIETITEEISRLKSELEAQARAGEISTEKMTQLKNLLAEMKDGVDALSSAIVASSHLMTSALVELPYMEGEDLEIIPDAELEKLERAADAAIEFSQAWGTGLDEFMTKFSEGIEFALNSLNRLTTMHAMSMQNQIAEIEGRQTAERHAYEAAGANREQLAELDKKHEKEKGRAKAEAARQQKALGIAQAAIHTAVAVAEALPNIPLSIAVGALGAAEVAVIAGTPIPQFRFGTDHHFGGLAEINEGPGGGEIVNLPRGSSVTSTFDQMGSKPVIMGKFDPHEIILYLKEQSDIFDYSSGG